MSSASGQKLFCEVCSPFKCPFDEFVGEKVVSQSYSSAILAPPTASINNITQSAYYYLKLLLPLTLVSAFL